MDLLERDAALCDLDVALGSAAHGEGRVALVSGEAGIGKTALIEDFARRRGTRARVLWGACDALSTPRPLGPVYEIAAQAGGLFAQALNGSGGLGAVFGAILSELQRQPAIVVVEDVHWADDATLDVLRYVGRRIGRTSALLVLTYRDDELSHAHPLRTLLGDLVSSATAVRVQLPALSECAVAVLVGERSIDAAALHRQTGGNPFFVTEVLASGGTGLPASVRDAVFGRIGRLSQAAAALLDAAAVGGPRVEPWLLSAMLPEALDALDECLAGGVLVDHGEFLLFRHELARQAVLEVIPPVRRRRLHRSALEALAATSTARADLARLAHHAEGAGDKAAILRYVPSAARRASASGAHRAAADLLAKGIRGGGMLPSDDLAALHEMHAMECFHVADMPGAIDSWRHAIGLWRDAGDRLREGMNLAVFAAALASAGQRVEARAANQDAIDLLATLPPGRELALAYGTQAILHQYNHELADAMTLAERAIELATLAGDTRIQVMAYDTLGMSTMFLDYARGCGYLEHARDLAMDAGLDSDVARAIGDLGAVSVAVFQLDQADRYLADGLAFTADRDLDRTRVFMLAWLSAAHLFRGRWSDAATRAGDVLARPASSSAQVVALLTLGRLEARRGDGGGQASSLDRALSIAGTPEELRLIGPVRAARAEAAMLAGDAPRCRSEADAAYERALQRRHQWVAGELAYWRWRAGVAERPPEWIATPFALQIGGDWRAASDAWQRLGCPYEAARALAEGDTAAQERALEIFDRLGAAPAATDLRRAMRARGAVRVPRGPRRTTRANLFGLTSRQLEILSLLAEGSTNAEIAERMSISPKTAEHHVAAVLAKLNVVSRQAAVLVARDQQMLA